MNRTILLAVLAVSVVASLSLTDDAQAQSTGVLADIVKKAVTKTTTFGQLPPPTNPESTIEMTFKRVVDGVDNNTFLIDGMPTTDADCRDEVWTFTIAKAIRPDATPTISIRSGQSFTSGGPSGCEFPPGSSTGLTATAGSPNTSAITLNWTAPADFGSDPITDYIVQYKKTSEAETAWRNDTRTASAATSETVTNLDSNTGYDFRVAAINQVDAAPFTPKVTWSTYPPTPAITPSVGTPSYSTVSLSWNASGDQPVTHSVYYRNSTAANTWTKFIDWSNSTTTETVTGLTPNTSYEFQVSAMNSAGSSANSTAQIQLTDVAVAPDPPTNLVADSYNSTSILVTWDKPAVNGGADVTKYFIQYKNSTAAWADVAETSSTTTSKIVTDLTTDVLYNFRVAAMNSVSNSTYFAGDSGDSTESGCNDSLAPQKSCSDYGTEKPSSKPGAPTELDFVITRIGVFGVIGDFTWKAPPAGNSAITEYFVAALNNAGNWGDQQCWKRNADTTCDRNNLPENGNYTWTVRAKNTQWGDERSFPMPMNLAGTKFVPVQITNLIATSINSTAVSLDWKKPLSGGATITDYNIYHRIGDSGAWILYNDGTSTKTNATMVNLPYGTQYDIRVAAVNSVGPGFGNNSTNTITYTTGLR